MLSSSLLSIYTYTCALLNLGHRSIYLWCVEGNVESQQVRALRISDWVLSSKWIIYTKHPHPQDFRSILEEEGERE